MARMEKNVIYIYHRDRDYIRAAAGRLALLIRGAEIRIASEEDAARLGKGEVVILENYRSMNSVAREITETVGVGTLSGLAGECGIIGFTSAVGGAGTSSAALMYGQILASLYDQRTLYLSLDFMASKSSLKKGPGRELLYDLLFGEDAEAVSQAFAEDPQGLYRAAADSLRNPFSLLTGAELSRLLEKLGGSFSRIVLDVPLDHTDSLQILDLCDSVVVCCGWDPGRRAPSIELFEYLRAGRPDVFSFDPLLDEDMPSDMYGQFGAEVRKLAQDIEG